MKKIVLFILTGGLFGFLGSLAGYNVAKKKYLAVADKEVESIKSTQKKHDENLLAFYGITPESKNKIDDEKKKLKDKQKPVQVDEKEHKTVVDYAKQYLPTVENPKNPVITSMKEIVLISEQEFAESDYEAQTVYFHEDGVVADTDANAIKNYKEVIGPDKLWRPQLNAKNDAVYVRNDNDKTVYEILYSEQKWEEIATPSQKSGRLTELDSESNEDSD